MSENRDLLKHPLKATVTIEIENDYCKPGERCSVSFSNTYDGEDGNIHEPVAIAISDAFSALDRNREHALLADIVVLASLRAEYLPFEIPIDQATHQFLESAHKLSAAWTDYDEKRKKENCKED